MHNGRLRQLSNTKVVPGCSAQRQFCRRVWAASSDIAFSSANSANSFEENGNCNTLQLSSIVSNMVLFILLTAFIEIKFFKGQVGHRRWKLTNFCMNYRGGKFLRLLRICILVFAVSILLPLVNGCLGLHNFVWKPTVFMKSS